MDTNNSSLTPNCPPPIVYEKTEKLEENYYNIKYNEKEYDLIITLYDNKNNKDKKKFLFLYYY